MSSQGARRQAGSAQWIEAIAAIGVLAIAAGCSQPVGEQVGEPVGEPVGKQVDERRAPAGADAGPLSVYVVNAPLESLARRIGGAHVDVSFPTPPDVDPAFWMPSPETINAYQSADLIFGNGAGYAAWTRQATLPRRTRVDTSAGFTDRLIPRLGGLSHGHGPQGEHSHGEFAFTTWLDPTLAVLQARAVTEALVASRPEHESDIVGRLAEVEAKLAALDARLARAFAPLRDQTVLFSHPVYDYLARRYGLSGHSLHWEPGERPVDPADWDRIEAWHAQRPIPVILFEGEPHPDVGSRLRALGIRTIVFAPGGAKRRDEDCLDVMAGNVVRVEQAAIGP